MKQILDKIVANRDLKDPILLYQLIDRIRPQKVKDEKYVLEQLHNLLAHLKSDRSLQQNLNQYITNLFGNYNPVNLYLNSGILRNQGFFSEFWTRLKHKILPESHNNNNTESLINYLFDKTNDFKWVNQIPDRILVEFFNLVQFDQFFEKHETYKTPLTNTILLLSLNLVSSGTDQNLFSKYFSEEQTNSPFFIQSKLISSLVEDIAQKEDTGLTMDRADKIFYQLDQCEHFLDTIKIKKNETGTSLQLIYSIRRLSQQLIRLKSLVYLLIEEKKDLFYEGLINLGKKIISSENRKNSLSTLVSNNIDLLAFEIVEHSARKGGKYIANNVREYWSYLRASMLGGLIIAFFASFKIIADGFDISPLGQGILFSVNYALCFVLVYQLKGIIATKQPAMTASSVVRCIDTNNDGYIDNLTQLKDLIIRVSRSQFISFLGNIICAFPVAYGIAMAYQYWTGNPFLGEYKAESMYMELHPGKGGALFYAAIAGVFLSLSGLISGYFDNKVVYSNIPLRIRQHPILIKWLSAKALDSFAKYTKKEFGALSGNISLGIFLGMAGTIGFITGLPIDIRHIAFSTANFGFVIQNGPGFLNSSVILIAMTGLLGIGVFNFLVSFGMTVIIALKSRKITFKQTRELSLLITMHMLRSPLDFLIHPGWKGSLEKSFSWSRMPKSLKVNIKE